MLCNLMVKCGSPDKCSCGPFICVSCRGLKVCSVSEPRPVLCRTLVSDANLFRPSPHCCSCHGGRLGTGSLNVLSPGYPVSLSENKQPPPASCQPSLHLVYQAAAACHSRAGRSSISLSSCLPGTLAQHFVAEGRQTLCLTGASRVPLQARSNSTPTVDCELSEFVNNL